MSGSKWARGERGGFRSGDAFEPANLQGGQGVQQFMDEHERATESVKAQRRAALLESMEKQGGAGQVSRLSPPEPPHSHVQRQHLAIGHTLGSAGYPFAASGFVDMAVPPLLV